MLRPFTVEFANIYHVLALDTRGWNYLFAEEKIQLTLTVLALMEGAYDKAFADCEEQDSGFAGSTSWTNNNPYRKDDDVLDIIANVQRNL